MGRSVCAVVVTAVIASSACATPETDTLPRPTAPTAVVVPTETPPDETRMAAQLTEGQLTASTVARPDTLAPCDPDDVTAWTARTESSAESAAAVIRLRNDGPSSCEVDIRSSARVDRFTEPDVWLEPGGGADLVVGDDGSGCDEPEVVLEVEVAIWDEVRRVPTSAIVPCDWALVAFYPVDAATVACDGAALEATRTDAAVVLRNAGFTGCVLGELVAVDGGRLGAPVDDAATIDWLAGGDVVAFPVSVGATGCEPVVVTLRFSSAVGDVAVDGATCEAVAPGVAFYDGDRGPLGAFVGTDDVAAAIAALDPFPPPGG